MITWRGFFYGLAGAVNLLVLMYTGMDVFLYLLILSLALPPLSALQLLVSMKMLKFRQELDPEITERKQKTNLIITFRQKGFFAPGLLDITVQRPQTEKGSFYTNRRLTVLAGEERNLQLEISCPHRGVFQTGITRIMGRDIFGLFWLPARTRKTCRGLMPTLTVMPREIDLESRDKLAAMLDHLQQQASPHFGTEINDIANLRAHLPGDSLKRVHWKLTARLNETMIKEYEKPQQQDILVLWHLEKIMLHGLPEADYLDIYTEAATAIARDILAAGSYIRCVSYQQQGRRQVEAGQMDDLRLVRLELAGCGWSGDIPLARIIREEAGEHQQLRMLLLLTTNLNPEILGSLRQVKMQGREVMLALLPVKRPDALMRRRLEQMAEEGIVSWIPVMPAQAAKSADPAAGQPRKKKDDKFEP